MLDREKIRVAVRKRLLAGTALPFGDGVDQAKRIAWENRDFTPPDPKSGDVLWIRETLVPALERQSGSNMLEFDGYVQFDVFVPRGRGTENAERMIKAIGDKLKPATSTVDPVAVHIMRAEALQGVDDGTWYGIPFQVTVKAFGPKD